MALTKDSHDTHWPCKIESKVHSKYILKFIARKIKGKATLHQYKVASKYIKMIQFQKFFIWVTYRGHRHTIFIWTRRELEEFTFSIYKQKFEFYKKIMMNYGLKIDMPSIKKLHVQNFKKQTQKKLTSHFGQFPSIGKMCLSNSAFTRRQRSARQCTWKCSAHIFSIGHRSKWLIYFYMSINRKLITFIK